MRLPRVATALVALTAGAAAVAAVRRLGARRRPAVPAATRVAAPAADAAPVVPAPAADAVVLPFTRRTAAAAAPQQPAAAARCGDTGGRTKAGAPCAARATADGRCHHHRLAA